MSNILDVPERIVEPLGTEEYFGELSNALADVLSADYVISTLNPVDIQGCPKLVYENVSSRFGRAMQAWGVATYPLYPNYKALRFGFELTTHRWRELSTRFGRFGAQPDQDIYPVILSNKEDIGFRTEGSPPNTEKIATFLHLPTVGATVSVTLSREKSYLGTGFSARELSELEVVRPLLTQLSAKHMEFEQRGEGIMMAKDLLNQLVEHNQSLTDRESEILNLILAGRSSLEISQALPISMSTVKTHRRNIFRKLGISHLRELYPLIKNKTAVSLDRLP